MRTTCFSKDELVSVLCVIVLSFSQACPAARNDWPKGTSGTAICRQCLRRRELPAACTILSDISTKLEVKIRMQAPGPRRQQLKSNSNYLQLRAVLKFKLLPAICYTKFQSRNLNLNFSSAWANAELGIQKAEIQMSEFV